MSETEISQSVEIERLDLQSMSIADDRVAKLREDFPEVFHEDKIDFDALKCSLGDWVDPGKERFGLNWPGKAECMRIIQEPSVGTLVPMREESVDFDTTKNVIIEGENLEVLKLLQKSYYGKVKMIYIDPPYNTGNEFIYPDNFKEGLQNYLRYSGQIDSAGLRLTTNSETEGRFHSKWLNMMYPRLFLSRNLLRDDGVILVSIDDGEARNLRALMDEIFGEENFIAQLVWAGGRKNDSRYISISHEYVMVYVRSADVLTERAITWRQRKEGIDEIFEEHERLRKLYGEDFGRIEAGLSEWFRSLPKVHSSLQHKHYRRVDRRGVYFPDNISWPGGGGPKYEVLHPITKRPVRVPSRGWMFASPERMQQVIDDDRVHFGPDETYVPTIKSYLKDREFQVPYSVMYQDGRAATKRLRALFGGLDVFDHPKDEVILKGLFEFATDSDDLVLDFFAGSGSTGHAIRLLNDQDKGRRRYVMVQLPEPIASPIELSDDYSIKSIADITRERMRRVKESLSHGGEGGNGEGDNDCGFRSFSLRESNFKPWIGDSAEASSMERQLEIFSDHLLDGRFSEDLLLELLLKSGFELTEAVERMEFVGKEVFSIADGAMLVCLERELSLEVIEAMAARDPGQIVVLDAGFNNNDQLKVNAMQAIATRARGGQETIAFKVV